MKKPDLWFLLRFVIVTALYALECALLRVNFMILDLRFFPYALFLYLTAIVTAFFFDEHIRLKIKLISDIVFLCLFIAATGIAFLTQGENSGDGMLLAPVFLFLVLPLAVSFSVWLARDAKAMVRLKGTGFLTVRHFSREHFMRILVLIVVYVILNQCFPFEYILAPRFFWFFILAYFMLFLAAAFLKKKDAVRAHLFADVFFLVIFVTQALGLIFSFMLSIGRGQTAFEFGTFDILSSLPMTHLCAIWLARDIKHFETEAKDTEDLK